MAEKQERIIEMLRELETRVVLLEKEKEDAIPGPRVELFVHRVVEPIKISVSGIERSIERIASEGQKTAEDARELYESYKDMLKREQARKDKEAEDKTVAATLKRWGAIAAAVGGIWFVFRIAGTLLEAYLKAHGFTQ
jgi:hypothetical protein